MVYRSDPDMEFLARCLSEDLDPLVTYLTRDKDGDLRLTEELTGTDEYKRHAPDHRRYWQLIATELQLFGGNSIMSIFRGGEGVLYREVLMDVCDKMDVNYNAKASTSFIESCLLLKILTDSIDNMDDGQLRELVSSLDLKTASFTGPAVAAALQGAVQVSGFVAYQVAVIVANAVAKQILGRGLSLAANAMLTKSIGVLAGPVGWALTGIWTLVSVAGPAYRVTMPAVIQVAFLRAKLSQEG